MEQKIWFVHKSWKFDFITMQNVCIEVGTIKISQRQFARAHWQIPIKDCQYLQCVEEIAATTERLYFQRMRCVKKIKCTCRCLATVKTVNCANIWSVCLEEICFHFTSSGSLLHTRSRCGSDMVCVASAKYVPLRLIALDVVYGLKISRTHHLSGHLSIFRSENFI